MIAPCLLVVALACLAHAQIGILFIDVSNEPTTGFKSQLINAIMGADLASGGRFSTPKIIKYHHYTNGQDFAIYDANNLPQSDIGKMIQVYVGPIGSLHMIVFIHPQGVTYSLGALEHSDISIHNVIGHNIKSEVKKFWRVFDQKLFGDFTERLEMCESEVVRQLVAGVRPEFPEITLKRLHDEYYRCIDEDIPTGRVAIECSVIAIIVVVVLKWMCNPKSGYENPFVAVPLLIGVAFVVTGIIFVGMGIGFKHADYGTLSRCVPSTDVNHRHQDYMIVNGTRVDGEWVDNRPDGVQVVNGTRLDGEWIDDGPSQLTVAGNMEILMQNGIVMHNGVRLECVW